MRDMRFNLTTYVYREWWCENRQLSSRWSWIFVTVPTNVVQGFPYVVTGVVPATTPPMPKSVYRSFLGNKKAWNIKLPMLVYFACVYMYMVWFCWVCIYSFIVSSRWGLNCGFSAPFVMPQGLLMQVLLGYQRFDS